MPTKMTMYMRTNNDVCAATTFVILGSSTKKPTQETTTDIPELYMSLRGLVKNRSKFFEISKKK